MWGRASCSAVALAAVLGFSPLGSASAANIFELNFWLSGPRYDGNLPSCESQTALDMITSRFSQKEGRFWESALIIEGYERVRETAYRPGPPNTIPRRFCSAVALVSDGRRHPVHYSIGETTGMIGAGWGVQWCVVGFDRNWAYSPACRMARP